MTIAGIGIATATTTPPPPPPSSSTGTSTNPFDGETHPFLSGGGSSSSSSTGTVVPYSLRRTGHRASDEDVTGILRSLYSLHIKKNVDRDSETALQTILSILEKNDGKGGKPSQALSQMITDIRSYLSVVSRIIGRGGRRISVAEGMLLSEITVHHKGKEAQYLIDQVCAILGLPGDPFAVTSIRKFQVGLVNSKSSTLEFGNFFAATAEANVGKSTNCKTAYAVSALALRQDSSTNIAWEPMVYAAAGDPNSLLAVVSLGQYINVGPQSWLVNDASLHLSARLTNGIAGAPVADRHLFEHVRAGDLWFDTEYRSLSNKVSGLAVETGLTYCVPGKGPLGYAMTISAKATYCKQKELGLDEGALEVAVPTFIGNSTSPVTVLGRYGTRGNGSISLTFKF